MVMARIIEVVLRGMPIQIAKEMAAGFIMPFSVHCTKSFTWFLASPLNIRLSSKFRRSVMRLAKKFYQA